MPLDIFGDYISDSLGMEYDWVYLVPVFNDFGIIQGCGDGYRHSDNGALGYGLINEDSSGYEPTPGYPEIVTPYHICDYLGDGDDGEDGTGDGDGMASDGNGYYHRGCP
jgi:hypothetical protein